jgi:hypothetical protein
LDSNGIVFFAILMLELKPVLKPVLELKPVLVLELECSRY